jgi:hypothetical protein
LTRPICSRILNRMREQESDSEDARFAVCYSNQHTGVEAARARSESAT